MLSAVQFVDKGKAERDIETERKERRKEKKKEKKVLHSYFAQSQSEDDWY